MSTLSNLNLEEQNTNQQNATNISAIKPNVSSNGTGNGKNGNGMKTPDQGNYQDFKKMIEANFIYVDKTDLLYKIAKLETAFIINAERRTGKTLFLSTIKAIFEEPKSWWEEHGKNLKICQLEPNFFDKNPYPVIHFNFASSPNNDSFIDRIRESLNSVITTYKLPLKKIEKKITLQKLIDVEFADILDQVKAMFNKPAVITIDEADQPLLNQIFDEDLTEIQIKNGMGETKKSFHLFYGYLKAKLASSQVRLVVVAGHSMIAKSAIYSAFNNPVMLRHSPQFHNLLGFTKEEILLYFKDQIKSITTNQGKTEEQLMNELDQHYNGYKYNVEAEKTLFNAFVIQNFFRSNGKFRNYFAESGSTKILLRSLQKQEISKLRTYLEKLSKPTSRMQMSSTEFTTPKDWEKLQTDFKQIAFDAGYLTIEKNVSCNSADVVDLKIPNSFGFQNMMDLLKDFLGKKDEFGEILQALLQGRFNDFFETLEEVAFNDKTFLSLAKNPLVVKIDANYEHLLHTIILIVLRLTLHSGKNNKTIRNFEIKNRKKPKEGGKVMDLYIEIEGEMEILFEFKILLENQNAEHAIKQVFEKKSDSEFKMDKVGQEKYIIGVAMDARKSKVIQDIMILKYSNENKSWDNFNE